MSNLLEVRGVTKKFGDVTILHGVDLTVAEGESVAIVGESGCGKTTLGKIIANVWAPTEGDVVFDGKSLSAMTKQEYKRYRLKVQMVQQDSFAALNPYKTVFHSIGSPLRYHKLVNSEAEARKRVGELLEDVGLTPVAHFINKYPHQLSGGQRQRVLVARALSVNPRLIVADEPVSMVDVSLRISLLQLMRGVGEKYGVSFVYITHDLATARYISDRGNLLVMYLGRVVEVDDIQTAVRHPYHPYFRALVAAVPEGLSTRVGEIRTLPLKGSEVPSVTAVPPGCSFHPRCLYATERCKIDVPELSPLAQARVACWNVEQVLELVDSGVQPPDASKELGATL